MKLRFFLAIIFLGTASVFFAGCSPKAPPKNSGVSVIVATAFATNVPVLIDPAPIGHVEPMQSATIRSQIGGILQAVHFKEGSEVRSNDLLFTIDARPAEAAFAHDNAQLENAQIQFDREQKLFDQKLVSQDEYDTSRSARDTLLATVQADKLNLSFCEIRAPFDGVVGGLQFHEGNVVKAPDDVLVTINQLHPIYATFSVPEKFLPEIQRQQKVQPLAVSATYENMQGDPAQGKLSFVDNTVDETTGTIQLRATFPNEDEKLWPGQFVQIELTLSELTNAVVVPSQAVQNGQNEQFIFVVKPDQTVESRPVKTGVNFDGNVVVESGLRAGETVVTDGQLRLMPGTTVSAKSQSSTNAP